jgi:hypothetical protein
MTLPGACNRLHRLILTRFTPVEQRYIISSYSLLESRQLRGSVVTELCVLLRIFGASVMLVVIIERLLRGRWRPA